MDESLQNDTVSGRRFGCCILRSGVDSLSSPSREKDQMEDR